MKLNGRWVPQLVDHVDRDSGNLYPIHIYTKIFIGHCVVNPLFPYDALRHQPVNCG